MAKQSSNAKGCKSEKKSQQLLEDIGCSVYTVKRPAYGVGGTDIFNCHDHVALYIHTGKVIFVQTKSNTHVTKKKYEEMLKLGYKYQYIFSWYDDKDEVVIRRVQKATRDNEKLYKIIDLVTFLNDLME